ncbi:ribonucleoside triphosphate reductase [Candidatus Dependentiae bacterium]
MEIKKRTGELVLFDPEKITDAILAAGQETREFGLSVAQDLTVKVLDLIKLQIGKEVLSIEIIQDIVEHVLLLSPYKRTAKAYILYRDQRSRLRDLSSKDRVELVDEYLKRGHWKVREDSNMSYSLQGLNHYIAKSVSKTYWLNKLYSAEIREAHASGDLHIHDLGTLCGYCAGWDLKDLLTVGFSGVPWKAESRPPKHLGVALGQIVNAFYTLQGETAGAQAFSNFDTLLAPFVRYDNLSYKQVKQQMQEFIYNTNVPTRVGFQTPFTNITLDLQSPSTLSKEHVIIGGKPQKETYSEFQNEMNMVNRAFLEVMTEGDRKGSVFTFPIPTYNITKDFDWENPELKPLWEMTAKYGIPYFANFINSDMSPDDARSMCCRLRLDTRELERRGGGLFGSNPLTGSIGVVTINMARIGYLAENETEFFARLDRLMEIARVSLEHKRKIVERLTDQGLYPYSKFYLRMIKERHGAYWHNHFATIGIIGVNEACLNFLGKDIGSDKGHDFAKKIMLHMRERLVEFQEKTGNIYNLEATPAEGTSRRLAGLDLKKFKDIKTAEGESGEHNACFYSNSTQLPVNFTDDVFKALDMQDDLQALYTGGTVFHTFLGESLADSDAVKAFIKRTFEKYKLPYLSLTPTFSVCRKDGYLVGKKDVCPKCGGKTEVYSRIVGYIRPVSHWNDGKQEEFRVRKVYTKL